MGITESSELILKWFGCMVAGANCGFGLFSSIFLFLSFFLISASLFCFWNPAFVFISQRADMSHVFLMPLSDSGKTASVFIEWHLIWRDWCGCSSRENFKHFHHLFSPLSPVRCLCLHLLCIPNLFKSQWDKHFNANPSTSRQEKK